MGERERRADIAAGSRSQFDYSPRFFEEPDPQQRMFEDERTAAMVLMAVDWADSHEAQFLKLVSRILEAHRTTGKPQSVRNMSIMIGCPHPHDLDAALARLMLMRFPELEGAIRLSKSMCDGYEWMEVE